MKTSLVLLSILSVLLFLPITGCERQATEPTVRPADAPLITGNYFGDVQIEFTAIDQIRVTPKQGTEFVQPMVSAIGIGLRTPAYRELAIVRGVYDPALGANRIPLDVTVRLDSTRVQALLTIRYYLAAGAFVDDEKTFSQLWTPYGEAGVLVTASKFVLFYGSDFQDIDRVGTRLFAHPFGGGGMFDYDLRTGKSTNLVSYGGGDCIAADSAFVFCETGGSIVRFNLTTNTVDKSWIYYQPGVPLQRFEGMEIYRGRLYLVSMEGWLKIMTLDFQPVDSMAYGKQTYYMTIENDILYSVQVGNLLNPYDPDQITRFDLRRKTFLPNIPSPARSLGGIRFYNGKFYYGDYLKGIVGVLSQYDLDVPLPDR